MFISYVFSTYLPPLMSTHFSQRQNHCRNASAKSAAETVLTAPSQSFLKLSLVNVRPASSFLTFGNKNKSVGARSGEYG